MEDMHTLLVVLWIALETRYRLAEETCQQRDINALIVVYTVPLIAYLGRQVRLCTYTSYAVAVVHTVPLLCE